MEELPERRKQAVEDVTSILGVSEDEAIRVLRKFKWCATGIQTPTVPRVPPGPLLARCQGVQGGHRFAMPRLTLPPTRRRDPSRVHEEWFSDVEAVRASLGIVDPPADSSQKSADTEVS